MQTQLAEWNHLANRAVFGVFGTKTVCIPASLALAEFLRRQGFDAEVYRCEVSVHSPGSYILLGGYPDHLLPDWYREQGLWNGHLAVACGGWVCDPTLDQAVVEGVAPSPVVFRMPQQPHEPVCWTEAGLSIRHVRSVDQSGWQELDYAQPGCWQPVLDRMIASQ